MSDDLTAQCRAVLLKRCRVEPAGEYWPDMVPVDDAAAVLREVVQHAATDVGDSYMIVERALSSAALPDTDITGYKPDAHGGMAF